MREAARILQRLSALRAANEELVTSEAMRHSMGGALAGVLGKGRLIVGKRNTVVGRSGDPATIQAEATLQALVDDTQSFDAAMYANTLQKPKKHSELELLQSASYPFVLMRWRTAMRNAMTAAGRYSVDTLDEALTMPLARLFGDVEGSKLAGAMAAERANPRGKYGALVTPHTAWKGTLQEIYHFESGALASLSPQDARRTLDLLTKVPAAEANFLGWLAAGEQVAEGGQSRFKTLNSL
ncbi:MAG: hypothetical protein AAB368_02185, partial [bacterium]